MSLDRFLIYASITFICASCAYHLNVPKSIARSFVNSFSPGFLSIASSWFLLLSSRLGSQNAFFNINHVFTLIFFLLGPVLLGFLPSLSHVTPVSMSSNMLYIMKCNENAFSSHRNLHFRIQFFHKCSNRFVIVCFQTDAVRSTLSKVVLADYDLPKLVFRSHTSCYI